MNDINNSLWDGWRIVKTLGAGGGGTVYEIERDLYGVEKAALKVISIPHEQEEIEELVLSGYDKESVTKTFRSYMQDIVQEYSLMADMKGNSNIVYSEDIRTIQHDDGIGWDILIRMELLTPLIKAMGMDVSESTVVKLAIDICNALDACSKRNIIHRDVKPQNIFMSKDGTYKLGDFGIARIMDKTSSATMGIGTKKFMAPEVARGKAYGSSVDIYALGLTLHWLLNRRRLPFLASNDKVPGNLETENAIERRLNGEPLPAPVDGSPELKNIVLKACAYAPEDRYASAAEMREDLLTLLYGVRKKAELESDEPKGRDDVEVLGDETEGPRWRKNKPHESVVTDEPQANKPKSGDDVDASGDETEGPKWGKNNLPKDRQEPPRSSKPKWWIIAAAALCVVAVFTAMLWEKPETGTSSYISPTAATSNFSTYYYAHYSINAQVGTFYGIDAEGIYRMENGEKTIVASGDYCNELYCTDGETLYVLKNDEATQKRILVRRTLAGGAEETLFEAPYGLLAGVIGEKIYFLLLGDNADDSSDNRLAVFDFEGNERETIATGIEWAYQGNGLILASSADRNDDGKWEYTVISSDGEASILVATKWGARIICDGDFYWTAPKNSETITLFKSDGKSKQTVCDMDFPEDFNEVSCADDILVLQKHGNDGYGEAFCLYDLKTGRPLSDRVLSLPEMCSHMYVVRDAVTDSIYAITKEEGDMKAVYQMVGGEMRLLTGYEYFNHNGGVLFSGINDGCLYYWYPADGAQTEYIMTSKKLPEMQEDQLADYIGKSVAEVKACLGPYQLAEYEGVTMLWYESEEMFILPEGYTGDVTDDSIVQDIFTIGEGAVLGAFTGSMTFPEVQQAAQDMGSEYVGTPIYQGTSGNDIRYSATVEHGDYALRYFWLGDPMLEKSFNVMVSIIDRTA